MKGEEWLHYELLKLEDIQLEKFYLKKAIELTVSRAAVKLPLGSYAFIGKDEKGKEVVVTAANLEEKGISLSSFKVGAKLAILNPQLKLGVDLAVFLKVADIKDLQFFKEGENFEKNHKETVSKLTALEIKNIGNKEFAAKGYFASLNIYGAGIDKLNA